MEKQGRAVCCECGRQALPPRLVPASTWYYIFDHDSSKEEMREGWGWPIRVTTRAVWEMARAKRDIYSPVYGKIFNCWVAYCGVCLPGKEAKR